jgi:hypothetical protein
MHTMYLPNPIELESNKMIATVLFWGENRWV